MSDQKVVLPKAMSKQTREGNYGNFSIHIYIYLSEQCLNVFFLNSIQEIPHGFPNSHLVRSQKLGELQVQPGDEASAPNGMTGRFFSGRKKELRQGPLERICRLLEVALCIFVLFS